MLQKFSFARVSAGAVALATLCPLPSHALTFRFQFSGGINIGTGEIQGYDTGQTYTDITGTQSIYQATGGSINFTSGAQSYSGTYNFKNLSSFPGVLCANIAIPAYDPCYIYPNPNDEGYSWNNKFNDSYLWQDSLPSVVFASADDTKAVSLWSIGVGQRLSLYDSTTTNWTDYSLTTFSPPTPVPAPLPLLGLGAATAFSRKLKQRIALKRKRDEVGKSA